jgi:predicted MPP superfamily phosphohydrolase
MAVTGNHDAMADPEDLGIFPFDNMDGCIKYLRSRRDGSYIAFAGVKDTGRRGRVWYAPPTPSAGLEYKSYILLSHNPDLVLHMPSVPFKVDAMISGHIHGGQIRTPFGLEFTLRHDELPHMGVISGLHEINSIKLFISKGVGCGFLPLRIGARPEVNVIEVYS